MPPYSVTLKSFRPAERYFPVLTPWTLADITENPAGPTEEGETVIETVDLAATPEGLDPDPENPQTRNFSTVNAVYPSAWYRIIFRDAVGAQGPTEWVAASGAGIFLPPQASVIRDRSLLLQQLYPEDGDATVQKRLREAVADATVLVESMTCRTLDAALAEDPSLARLALIAVTGKSEQLGAGSSARRRRTAVSNGNLKSISAGPWSESYFGPQDAAKARTLDPDPRIHEAMWALATEECRANWLALWDGEHPAFGMAQEFNWFPEARGGY